MDEKDNSEAPKEDMPNNDGVQDSGGESIKVNITDSTEANDKVEPEPSADGEVKLEDIDKSTDNIDDKDSEAVSDSVVSEPSSQSDNGPVNPEEAKPIDNTPDLVPSVQPKMSAPMSPLSEVAQLKNRNKKLKVWLVVFVIFLVAIVAGGLVYFSQQSSSNQDLEDANAKNAALQQELLTLQQTSAQESTDALNKQLAEAKSDNAELTTTVADQEATIAEYQQVVTDLQEACGTACSDIEVPEDTTTN